MTKKKKSILSDQRFIVLLVIIVLFAIFSFKSREFRQYTTILSMLDFSYYDLLMAIGVTFPLITGGVDLSIGTGMVCYALIGAWNCNRRIERCSHWYHEPAAIPCYSLYLYDYPWCWFSLQCYTMANTESARRMVPFHL